MSQTNKIVNNVRLGKINEYTNSVAMSPIAYLTCNIEAVRNKQNWE